MANIPIFAHPARRLRQIQLTLLATPPALFLVFHCDPRHILVVTGCQDWFRLTIHFGVFLLKTTPADSGIFQRVVRHCGCLVPKAYQLLVLLLGMLPFASLASLVMVLVKTQITVLKMQ